MSATGASRSLITPDFVYILQIREYQHVLRPGDQKSADNIVLAKAVIGDVETAKDLLIERGPFLVAEKQQVMSDIIDDTEDAIDRVIKLLSPARIEQVSEESVRINTKNPYTLQSENPKAAATFSRLQIASNRLGTVLHDLRNIEATAQLDTCDIRATTSVRIPPSRSKGFVQKTPSMNLKLIPERHDTVRTQRTKEYVQLLQLNTSQNDVVTTPEQSQQTANDTYPTTHQDPKTLIPWKRSRRGSKHTNSSAASSVSGTNPDEQDTSIPRTPISSQGNALSDPFDTSTKSTRDLRLNGNSMHLPEAVVEARLPVIHELDATSPAGKLAVRRSYRDELANFDRSIVPQLPDTEESPRCEHDSSTDRTQVPQHINSGPKANAREASDSALQSDQNAEPDFRRETFADYKKRYRKTRQETNGDTLPTATPPARDMLHDQGHDWSSIDAKYEPHIRQNDIPRLETDFRPTNDMDQQQPLPNGHTTSPPKAREHRVKLVSRLGPPRPVDNATPAADVSQVFTPTRMQISPQVQTPVSASHQIVTSPSLHLEASSRSHGIAQGDPGVGRIPTLLRVGEKKEELTSVQKSRPILPYPVSEAGSDEEFDRPTHLRHSQRPKNTFERSTTVPTSIHGPRHAITPLPTLKSINENSQNPLERSVTVPLDSQRPSQVVPLSFPNVELGERTHHRSQSGTIPKEGDLSRAPTIPRKPLPYRKSFVIDEEESLSKPIIQEEDRISKFRQVSAVQPVSEPRITSGFRPISAIQPVLEIHSVPETKPVPEVRATPKLTQNRSSDLYRSSFNPPSPIGSGIPQPDEKLDDVPPLKDLPLEKSKSHVSSRKSSVSSGRHSMKGLTTLRDHGTQPRDIAGGNERSNSTQSAVVESAAELSSQPMSPISSKSVQVSPPVRSSPNLKSEDVSRPVQSPQMTLSERMQTHNPLTMHPVDGGQRSETAHQAHPVFKQPISTEPLTTEVHSKTQALPRTQDTGPNTGSAYVPTPLHLLNVERAEHAGRSRNTSRSRTTPEPVLQTDPDVQRASAAPRRASAQASIDSGLQKRAPDPALSTDRNSNIRPVPRPNQTVDGTQILRGPVKATIPQPTEPPSADRRVKPAKEPSAFQAQNFANGIPNEIGPSGERKQSTDRELFREHMWSAPQQQPPPPRVQQDQPPLGCFPGPGVYHLQQPPSQPLGPPQQPWQSTQLLPHMHHIQPQQPQQPGHMMPRHDHQSQPSTAPFPGAMQQIPVTYQQLPQPQPHFHPQFQQQFQPQGPPQFQLQPLPSPLPPGHTSQPNHMIMMPPQQQWGPQPPQPPQHHHHQFMPQVQPAFPHQSFHHQPPPPPAQSDFSSQQCSPIQSPNNPAQQIQFPTAQQSPPRRSSPPAHPRPMSYASTSSQDHHQSNTVPIGQFQGSPPFQPISQIRPISPIHHSRLPSVVEGVVHRPTPSISSNTDFAMGRPPSVPMLGNPATGLSSAPSQAKNKSKSWLHYQASKVKR